LGDEVAEFELECLREHLQVVLDGGDLLAESELQLLEGEDCKPALGRVLAQAVLAGGAREVLVVIA
jgi:hypothetical protein